MTSDVVFHLALPGDWSDAQEVGEYRISTRGRSLDDEGFIHCSTESQLEATANRFYADLKSLVVLTVDLSGVGCEVRWEPPVPGSDELFPHLYGPMPLAAVVKVSDWSREPPAPWQRR